MFHQKNSFQGNAKTFNLLILSRGMWNDKFMAMFSVLTWPRLSAYLWTTCRGPASVLPSLSFTTLPSTPRWGRETRPARPPRRPSPPSSPSWGPARRAAAVATPTWSSRPEVSYHQSSPLPLVELQRGSSILGRELSNAKYSHCSGSLWHRDSWLPCMERS